MKQLILSKWIGNSGVSLQFVWLNYSTRREKHIKVCGATFAEKFLLMMRRRLKSVAHVLDQLGVKVVDIGAEALQALPRTFADKCVSG